VWGERLFREVGGRPFVELGAGRCIHFSERAGLRQRVSEDVMVPTQVEQLVWGSGALFLIGWQTSWKGIPAG
jgi:hypothetical protein